MRRQKSFSERRLKRNIKAVVRDALLLLSLTGVGSNLLWCWQHNSEIEKLRKQITSAKSSDSPVTLLR